MHFAKGHGTQNDFVVLFDPDVKIELLRTRVAALCDRRRGIGADGVLRVARAGALRDAGVLDRLPVGVGADDWFMDYRNGDGTIAEMCGNGVRVFAHYVRAHGLVDGDRFVVGSRAGARPVTVHKFDETNADVSVEMGDVQLLGASSTTLGGRTFDGIGIDVGNPHLACVDASADVVSLRELDLSTPPDLDADFFRNGANVEIVTRLQFGRVDMRVFERGVGETRSCGTGTVAAAAAALSYEGLDSGSVVVGVPGGEVTVTIDDSGSMLRGPSVLLAEGTVDDTWWQELG
ncbi:diaminopimelate epimerase [Rhodococcus sp. BP-252]|uniref:Diaminopimelate epimerase n=1 Tax=Rhodococcoides kyotonense TaxID=398843 RepID=A0A177YBE5_9NOCA|nr:MULTISPECIES: diaminopimelate epimerase [Rhodococcus]MBY6410990.1 diaminopimelate epimerase [Rhodococcus sp. BP-320]MBY6415649.1 diaminopimelate epimerase [Rhodococcus sp. BP-321]MBY6420969.1 diaminopimelate epimerase [Rhodococcus sp. BP-324]MBY6426024.1 diaminopimelate epimerase [Rhodococcus sp. BP-323]MBY6430855.1 diaminopimelate epimerase [Rhodococcus sp. BP-322]